MNGQYQNNITDLPGLESYRYENIFKVYQTGDKDFYFYNIIKNIKIPRDINSNVFDTIILPNNLPYTVLSYQIYGTTYLWWLLCIVNDIRNPFDNAIAGKKIKIIKRQYLKTILDGIAAQLQ